MNTIEETIKMAGLFKKKVVAKQIQLFEDKFANEGESVLAACFSKDGQGQLYVTDKRVHANIIKGMLSNQESSIPLSNITSITVDSKFVFGSIAITTSGTTIKIDDVPVAIAQEVKSIIEHLKSQGSKSESYAATKDTFDLADEIRELKDLLDEGILTQDEFDAKKKQLLGV